MNAIKKIEYGIKNKDSKEVGKGMQILLKKGEVDKVKKKLRNSYRKNNQNSFLENRIVDCSKWLIKNCYLKEAIELLKLISDSKKIYIASTIKKIDINKIKNKVKFKKNIQKLWSIFDNLLSERKKIKILRNSPQIIFKIISKP